MRLRATKQALVHLDITQEPGHQVWQLVLEFQQLQSSVA